MCVPSVCPSHAPAQPWAPVDISLDKHSPTNPIHSLSHSLLSCNSIPNHTVLPKLLTLAAIAFFYSVQEINSSHSEQTLLVQHFRYSENFQTFVSNEGPELVYIYRYRIQTHYLPSQLRARLESQAPLHKGSLTSTWISGNTPFLCW